MLKTLRGWIFLLFGRHRLDYSLVPAPIRKRYIRGLYKKR